MELSRSQASTKASAAIIAANQNLHRPNEMTTYAPPALFNPATENYIICFECFMEENDLLGLSEKRVLFLSYCNPEVFETATVLTAPVAVQTVPWTHHAPMPSKIIRWH